MFKVGLFKQQINLKQGFMSQTQAKLKELGSFITRSLMDFLAELVIFETLVAYITYVVLNSYSIVLPF